MYVVGADNVVEKRAVRLGRLHDGLREIESGVKPGERVVVDGLQRVRGGVDGRTAETVPAKTGEIDVLARFFIDRPVFAWVISIVIVLVGADGR